MKVVQFFVKMASTIKLRMVGNEIASMGLVAFCLGVLGVIGLVFYTPWESNGPRGNESKGK